jgi:hypothetical protein
MKARILSVVAAAAAMLIGGSSAALACGGLVAPGHAEVLQKATTLAAWHGGYEHYVTGFQFAGAAQDFGYIIPLPGVPVRIQKAGDWTLERLERELNPLERLALAAVPAPKAADVQVIQRVRVDALDITVVRGGGADVVAWATRNGFDLTPDASSVLGRYSSSKAVFALAKFNRGAASREGLFEGQGTVIHFVIPTKGPWIPLRILAMGKSPVELVDADLFVLTDERPDFAPSLSFLPGMSVRASEPASASLLSDLRTDRGMRWLPASGMWLTALHLQGSARDVTYDLSIDGGGPVGVPVAAVTPFKGESAWTWVLTGMVGLAGLGALWVLWRPAVRPRPA